MDMPSIQETLSRTLGTAAPRGQQGPIPPFGHLCSSPAFVPSPCAPSQPARQPSPSPGPRLAAHLSPPFPFGAFAHPPKCQSGQRTGGAPYPPRRPSPQPAAGPAALPVTRLPLLPTPLAVRPLEQSLPSVPSPLPLPSAPALQSRESGVISPRSPPSRLLPRPLRLSFPPASAPSRSLTLSLSRCPPLSPPPLCFSGELAPRDSSHTAVPLVRRQRRRGLLCTQP
uniref:Uncharacterized protein n=1 Tax=Mustela putorius furo TaxID=9669 RepID=M3YJM7_MUSPF